MRMPSINPVSTPMYTRVYGAFRGVDFSTDATQVDLSRSPGAQNMVSDSAGFPEKRPGWRWLHKVGGNINGLFYAVFEDGTRTLMAHIGTGIYTWSEPDEETQTTAAPVLVADGMADARSRFFSHRGKVYLLDGTKYRVLTHDADGYHLKAVEDDEPYVPTLRINITGNEVVQIGNSGKYYGGHTYEEFEEPNVLTYRRKVTMCGDGQSKKFYLGETDVDSVETVTANDVSVPAFVEGETQTQWYKLDEVTGLITFKTAPAMHEDGAGLANIEIEYTKQPTKRDEKKDSGTGTKKNFDVPEEAVKVAEVYVDGNKMKLTDEYTVDLANHLVKLTTAPKNKKEVRIVYVIAAPEFEPDRINGCTLCDSFGFYNDNRFFVAGENDEKYLNCDYMSGTDDPTYFPYDGYVRVGADTSRIMGYMKQFDAQIIVKEDNEQDAQVFLRQAEFDNEDGAMFPLKQGIKGVGAVSKEAFGVLRDDPMFLSDEGVFALESGQVRDQQSVQDRSFFINKRLTKEAHLENACAAVYKGYYLLAVNGNVYVADSRQRTAMSDTEAVGYEWYYWTGMPVKFFFVHDKALYFAAEGGICRLSDDYSKTYKYADGAYPMIKESEMTEEQRTEYRRLMSEQPDKAKTYRRSLEPGEAIEAVWITKADVLDTMVNLKSVPKKGCALMVKPYTRSSVELGYLTNREGTQVIKTEQTDIFDFEDIDFDRMTFNTFDLAQIVPFNRKIKKFGLIQFIIKSKELNEGFGVYGIQLSYMIGRYVK